MPSCPPLRGLQNLLRPTSIRMARHQELSTTHSPMTLTAIQNCRHVSIADRSLPWRRLHKGTGKAELIRAGRSWRRERKEKPPQTRGACGGFSDFPASERWRCAGAQGATIAHEQLTML